MRIHVCLFIGVGLLGCGSAHAAPVPLEAFFQAPAITSPRLSDDGRRLVMLVPHESGRQSVAQIEVDTQKGGLVAVPSDYDVDFATWKDDLILFGGDAGGNESLALRSIRPDGTDWKDLNESYDPLRPLTGPVGGNIVAMLREDKSNIMVLGLGTRRNRLGGLEAAGGFGYYRLNIRTGRRTLVEPMPEKMVQTFGDPITGQSYGRLMQDGAETVLFLALPGTGDYRPVARFRGSEETWSPLGITPDGAHCWVIVRGEDGYDRGALVEYDLRSGERARVGFVPPEGEIVDLIRGRRGELWGLTYESERVHHVWFDQRMGQLHRSLQATFPGTTIDLIDKSMDGNRLLVLVHSDRDPGTYYVWDQNAAKLLPVGQRLPQIDPKQMAPRTPVHYAARDGLTIHGYLTRSEEGGKGSRPLIILPHGGPFGIRDSWVFDAEAQFLASRGYAVLQVNYRGSGGYGSRFQYAGKQEWGRKMQDDLTDGVKWAIDQGITTPDRVGIMGGSYGGYATLAGLVFTPELYRCGVNYVGVSDLRMLSKTTRDRGRGYRLFTGNWIGSDDAELHDRSPVNFVERIRVPTLHAYGENDPRVDIAHWRALEHELKKHDKPYQFFRERNEGHGFQNAGSRITFYKAVEEFLAEHLMAAGKVEMGELKTTELPANERD